MENESGFIQRIREAQRGKASVPADLFDSAHRAEKTLRRRVQLETLIASISTQFINLGANEIDGGIDMALRQIGEFAGVDRSYVFQLSEDEKSGSNTHEWCAEGIEPQIGNLQNLPVDAFPWWMERLTRFEKIHLPKLADLPPEAGAEREIIEAQGIQSLVAVPIITKGRLVGFLGFDSVREEKAWDEEDFALLETLSGILGSGLERRRAERERERLAEQLRQAQKMEAIGRLAGGIAHDFNNLLTVILGHVEILMDSLSGNESQRAEVQQVREAAQRAVTLTQQLLAFSRKQMLKPDVLNLNVAVQNMEEMLRRLLGEHIDLTAKLEPNLGRTQADQGQIEQVILNLVLNARDAMPDGGELTIRTANFELGERSGNMDPGVQPGRYVLLEVSDTGMGMDAATRHRIFEPFFTTKGPGKGTGLGLATVYGIVKQHGGHISVASEPGAGTRFEIWLPRALKEEGEEDKRARRSRETRGSETVLLVEDDAGVRALLRRILSGEGYRVLAAADGAEAARLSRDHSGPIQLLLTDVVLPQASGREVAERLVQARHDMKVLYISGYTSGAFSHDGIKGGEVAFLPKPFTPEALKQTVRDVLDRPPAVSG